jgi:hypothetical protein
MLFDMSCAVRECSCVETCVVMIFVNRQGWGATAGAIRIKAWRMWCLGPGCTRRHREARALHG